MKESLDIRWPVVFILFILFSPGHTIVNTGPPLLTGDTGTPVQGAIFFSKAAFVTFGGAYVVLTYIADMAVNHYGWLNAHQMVQGLGLEESTPGPLIMVTQYIGFLAAWNLHGEFNPLFNAVLGAFITTYMTSLPCFFFIFLGVPYIEMLSRNCLLQAAFMGVASAVVGVIVNLGVFFGQKVLFPAPGVFDYFAAVLALASFGLALKFRIQMHSSYRWEHWQE